MNNGTSSKHISPGCSANTCPQRRGFTSRGSPKNWRGNATRNSAYTPSRIDWKWETAIMLTITPATSYRKFGWGTLIPSCVKGWKREEKIDRSGASYIKSQRTETFGVAVLKEKDRFTRIPLRKLPYSLAISGPCLLSMTTRQPALSHMTTACCQYWLCPSVSKAAGTCWKESTHARHQGLTRNHVICFWASERTRCSGHCLIQESESLLKVWKTA